jgi:hypothetical protein
MPAKSRTMQGPHYVPPLVPQYAARLRMEERHNAAESHRLVIEGCMRHDGSNEGRAATVRTKGDAESVNGTETRASRRWRLTPPTARPAHWSDGGVRITGLPLWLVMALDTPTIARHWPAHVTPLADADGREPRERDEAREARDAAVAREARETAAKARGAHIRGTTRPGVTRRRTGL